MGFFAIMNPIANVPIFLSLTAGDDRASTRAVALRAVSLAFVIVALFCVAGNVIFETFGITLPAFRLTGGILVFLIGFHMLQGEQSPVHAPSAEDNRKSREAELGVAISPLAMPILAGPGTIATGMNYTAGAGVEKVVITLAAFAALCAITYVFFVSGRRLVEFIGDSAIKVVTRMMGLILGVIGIQMIMQGVHGAIETFR
jgi:multiple antibiotic resistance protein